MVRGVDSGNFGGNSECSDTLAVGKGDGNWSHCFNCADCAPQRPLGTTSQLTHLLLPYAHYCTLSSIRRSLSLFLSAVSRSWTCNGLTRATLHWRWCQWCFVWLLVFYQW